MWPNLVTFIVELRNGKLQFLSSAESNSQIAITTKRFS